MFMQLPSIGTTGMQCLQQVTVPSFGFLDGLHRRGQWGASIHAALHHSSAAGVLCLSRVCLVVLPHDFGPIRHPYMCRGKDGPVCFEGQFVLITLGQ